MNAMNWSLRIGRVFGITIRLHLFLLIFLGVEFLSWTFKSNSAWGLVWFFLDASALFLIILLHEFGHCFAGRSVGGRADEILLWPLGGLAYVHAPNTPSAQMKTAIGGPAVNIGIGIILAFLILVIGVPLNMNFEGWYSLQENLGYLYWIKKWMEHVFKLNLILLMFNLLPAFPMDGGRILQCFLWPKIGFTQATLKAIFFGNICAIGMVIIGIFWEQFLLVFIALFVYMQGAQMKLMIQEGLLRDESVFGYDFSQGYTSLEASWQQEKPRKPGLFERWSKRQKQKRLEKKEQELENLDKQVDELLIKVSENGLHSLTEQERTFLRKASKRYKE